MVPVDEVMKYIKSPNPEEPTSGTLFLVETAADGVFLFLYPFEPTQFVPAVVIRGGEPAIAFCVPGTLQQVLKEGPLVVSKRGPRVKDIDREQALIRAALAKRGENHLPANLSVQLPLTWKREFAAWRRALELLADLWQSAGGGGDLAIQSHLASALTLNAVSFAGVFQGCRNRLAAGTPNTPERFARVIAALLYWGFLWKLRNQLPSGKPGGISFEEGARFLNLRFSPRVLPWWDARWKPFTGGVLKGIIQRQEMSSDLPR